MHASSGTRTHGPSVRAGEDILCLRPRGQRDQHREHLSTLHLSNIRVLGMLKKTHEVRLFKYCAMKEFKRGRKTPRVLNLDA
jgi:hypothetical protein